MANLPIPCHRPSAPFSVSASTLRASSAFARRTLHPAASACPAASSQYPRVASAPLWMSFVTRCPAMHRIISVHACALQLRCSDDPVGVPVCAPPPEETTAVGPGEIGRRHLGHSVGVFSSRSLRLMTVFVSDRSLEMSQHCPARATQLRMR